MAGPPDTGLDLVKKQQQAKFVARLAQAFQESRVTGPNAAFALDSLDQNPGGLGRDGIAYFVQIAKGYMIERIDHRPKACPMRRISAG